jgi:cytochrome c oxidase assembly protein subunit 15
MVAYALLICAVLHAIDAMSTARRVAPLAVALAAAIVIQAVIGIMTLLQAVPISLGLAHQGGAVIVLALAVMHAQAMMVRRTLPVAGTFAPSR